MNATFDVDLEDENSRVIRAEQRMEDKEKAAKKWNNPEQLEAALQFTYEVAAACERLDWEWPKFPGASAERFTKWPGLVDGELKYLEAILAGHDELTCQFILRGEAGESLALIRMLGKLVKGEYMDGVALCLKRIRQAVDPLLMSYAGYEDVQYTMWGIHAVRGRKGEWSRWTPLPDGEDHTLTM